MKAREALTMILVCLAGVAILEVADMGRLSFEEESHLEYCAMVKMKREHPDRGWPDYKGNYDTTCMEPNR